MGINEIIVNIIFIILAIQCIILIITGKAYYMGLNKYTDESVKEFSKAGGIAGFIATIAAMVVHYSLVSKSIIWLALTGFGVAIIALIAYVIFSKKYLVKK